MITIQESKNKKICTCEHCGARHVVYHNYFHQKYVGILAKIWKYCIENDTNIVERKRIGFTPSQYAEMAKLQWFGLLYKEGDEWKMPRKRVKEFFSGSWPVAQYCERDVTKKEHKTSDARVTIDKIVKTQDAASYRDFYRQFVEYIEV